MKFDIELHKQFGDIAIIDYGIIKGNNNIILFIKSGQDGSMYGYKNKYLKIAKNISKKYGATVICSSNPFDGNNPLDNAMEVIEDYCRENNIKRYEIYYMGHSNGALIGAWFGYKYPKIKRMLLVNPPLMYNWHKTKEGLYNFEGERVVMIHGGLDQSNGYTPLLNGIAKANFEHLIIEGQDHDFSKDVYDFKKLPEEYLFNNILAKGGTTNGRNSKTK